MKIRFSGFRLLANCISIVLLFTILLISGGCTYERGESKFQALNPAPYSSDDRDKAWRNDLKYLEDNLRAFHANLFYEMSEQDFDNAVSTLYDSIPSLTDNEIEIELSKIVAMIGDSHTALHLINPLLAPTIDFPAFPYLDHLFRIYPLRAWWFTDGLFVVGSTKEHTETLGTRIIQIGNKAPEEIRELVKPLIPHSTEEAIAASSPKYIISPEILHTFGIIDDIENASFTFEDREGNTFQLNLSPYNLALLSEEDIKNQKFAALSCKKNPLWETALMHIEEDSYPLYLKNPFSNYWFEYLEDYKTVYFQFNVVKDMPEGKSFSSFFKEMLDFIDHNDIDKLVIDLRLNGGGDYTIAESQFKNLGKHKINKEGQIFTIIGRGTDLAAIASAEFIKENTNSLFFGEGVYDTLDMYYHNLPVYLPNSKICFVIAHGRRVFPDIGEQIVPDVKIAESSEDYLSGRDVILERILVY